MRTSWLRILASWALLAAGCSEDMSDPFGSSTLSAGDSGDSGASTSSATTSTGGDDVGTGETSGVPEGTETSAAATSGSDDDTTMGSDAATGSDGGESSTAGTSEGGAVDCVELAACQPCVDCTVAPGGMCQDEALACQNDAECNALAGCYNGCAMMLMGDELMACVQTCYDDHPDAVDAFMSAYGCFLDVCGTLCM